MSMSNADKKELFPRTGLAALLKKSEVQSKSPPCPSKKRRNKDERDTRFVFAAAVVGQECPTHTI